LSDILPTSHESRGQHKGRYDSSWRFLRTMRYSLRRALSLDSVDGCTHNPTRRRLITLIDPRKCGAGGVVGVMAMFRQLRPVALRRKSRLNPFGINRPWKCGFTPINPPHRFPWLLALGYSVERGVREADKEPLDSKTISDSGSRNSVRNYCCRRGSLLCRPSARSMGAAPCRVGR